MKRFSSLAHVPAETRRTLRDRFRRFLRPLYAEVAEPVRGRIVADELVLRLLLLLKVEFASDLERAKATYDASMAENPGEPSFDDVLAAGWMRVVNGRIRTSFEIACEATRRSPESMNALAATLKKRFEQRFVLRDFGEDLELAPLAAEVQQGDQEVFNFHCRDPRWVAARLWDRSLGQPENHSAELRLWLDRWRLLGAPKLVPSEVWAEGDAMAFCQTAFEMLGTEPSLVGWQETRSGFLKEMALVSGREPEHLEQYITPVAETLVERAQWFDDPRLERAIFGVLESQDAVSGLVRILLGETESAENAPAPHWVVSRLLELGMERPELLLIILFQLRSRPVLLADLVLFPRTSALACLLVARWHSMDGSAWDRELTSHDDETTKDIAFADAVAIMGHFLENKSLPAAEVAGLLKFLHRSAKPGFVEDSEDARLGILRTELVRQSQQTQQKIFAELASAMPHEGLGTPTFAAALDVLGTGDLATIIDPAPLLEAYSSAVAAGRYDLSTAGIGTHTAASLIEVALRASDELRTKFLRPIDIRARIAAAALPGANSYIVNDETARSIRAHVRVLCRAVVGLQSPPDTLSAALVEAVRIGALSHAEKERVAAFAARFETRLYGQRGRPMAADLGTALGALAGNARAELLTTILEIDEPLVLAQLLNYAPYAVRSRIKDRIAAITPSNAGDTRSLPEAMARIDALLSAGLPESAAKFMEEEQGLETFGKVSGREVVRLRAAMALKLLRGDWAGVVDTEPPPELVGPEKDAAIEAINLYRALAAIYDPKGNKEGATQLLRQLQSRHPQVASYTINLFAAQIMLLLGDNLFTQLYGPAMTQGRQLLAEAERDWLRLKQVSTVEVSTFEANRALLLLALGQPDQARETLLTVREPHIRDRVAAYSAIALARMGRVSEALAALDQADSELGKTDIVSAARAHIKTGARYSATANLSREDNPIPRLKEALWDFSQLDHLRQAEVSEDSFESLAIKHVRAAAETVTSLVPMMKSISMESREDDLNALVGALLSARVLSPLGWTVPDQSRGGFTAKGGPGERDLILQKNGTLLAIVEALKCDSPLTQKAMRNNLTNHFVKLLGYGRCNLYFHLTYSYLPNTADVIDYLRKTAEADAPEGFTYVRRDEIDKTDGRPAGFVARYQADLAEVAVVFLVLDMQQSAQREAGRVGRPNG
ncbi:MULTISPECIES: hypothetical protein [unclassified Bradyrhizobium]|uniref:hypothetical protein n=1 Tax=unclassified Bradyrhizobium TaxID=2631580 RepID=UPI002916AEAC|nr:MULTISPECIES: hypothetical protein [unclassified Bradyrhizobium]